jgi:NAD(P)-dependent dehydrogenase (short-subunit alcohol dehydrogenase family)
VVDRSAVVTGAARGIGAAIARELARQGLRVHAVDREPMEPTVAAAPGSGSVVPWVCDVSDPEPVARLVRDVAAQDGRVDVLVNNAGISRPAPVAALEPAVLDEVLATNLGAALLLTKALLPLMGRGSAVVNVTSLRAARGFPDDVAYIASKGALEAATRALAVELGPQGIRVNAVAPGAIATDLNAARLAEPGVEERVLGRIPVGRLGRPEDVARVVAFLVGADAGFVTGAVVAVDGGQAAMG